MTVVDFIDVIDDIIDLSSDEEAVEHDHNATHSQAMLLDKQAVFVLAGEERQDEQAAFGSAGEESQEATEFGNATASPLVMEKVSLHTAGPKNCPSSSISAPLPGPTSTTPEVGDTQRVMEKSPSVMEKAPLATAESENCPKSPATAPLPGPASTTPKALTYEDGDTKLVIVRGPNKKYHTSTPRRSPRFEEKPECCSSCVEEPAADPKRPRMLEAAEE